MPIKYMFEEIKQPVVLKRERVGEIKCDSDLGLIGVNEE